MQVTETREAMSALEVKHMKLSGNCESIIEDVGEALDQSAGMSSKGTEVAIALDLALHSDSVKKWVLDRVAEKVNSGAHLKLAYCDTCPVANLHEVL